MGSTARGRPRPFLRRPEPPMCSPARSQMARSLEADLTPLPGRRLGTCPAVSPGQRENEASRLDGRAGLAAREDAEGGAGQAPPPHSAEAPPPPRPPPPPPAL